MGVQLPGIADGWAKIAQHLPHKSLKQLAEYGSTFEYYLSNADPKSAVLPGNIPVQSIFMDKRPQEVLFSNHNPSFIGGYVKEEKGE